MYSVTSPPLVAMVTGSPVRCSCRADRICVECSWTLSAGTSKLPASLLAITHCRNTGRARRIRFTRASWRRDRINLVALNEYSHGVIRALLHLPPVFWPRCTGRVCGWPPSLRWTSSWWCRSSAGSAGCRPPDPPDLDTEEAERLAGWTWTSPPLWGRPGGQQVVTWDRTTRSQQQPINNLWHEC